MAFFCVINIILSNLELLNQSIRRAENSATTSKTLRTVNNCSNQFWYVILRLQWFCIPGTELLIASFIFFPSDVGLGKSELFWYYNDSTSVMMQKVSKHTEVYPCSMQRMVFNLLLAITRSDSKSARLLAITKITNSVSCSTTITCAIEILKFCFRRSVLT